MYNRDPNPCSCQQHVPNGETPWLFHDALPPLDESTWVEIPTTSVLAKSHHCSSHFSGISLDLFEGCNFHIQFECDFHAILCAKRIHSSCRKRCQKLHYFLRVIPTLTHYFEISSGRIYSIYIYIYSDILSDILFGIYHMWDSGAWCRGRCPKQDLRTNAHSFPVFLGCWPLVKCFFLDHCPWSNFSLHIRRNIQTASLRPMGPCQI